MTYHGHGGHSRARDGHPFGEKLHARDEERCYDGEESEHLGLHDHHGRSGRRGHRHAQSAHHGDGHGQSRIAMMPKEAYGPTIAC